ncbi:MAG TPA: hypothetical protein VFY66_04610, partial [Anaerolineales bacterium]|nr:hypothetical protein [Anaerolineales bacterium]
VFFWELKTHKLSLYLRGRNSFDSDGIEYNWVIAFITPCKTKSIQKTRLLFERNLFMGDFDEISRKIQPLI